MAEIRVAPQRRNRAIVWILLLVIVLAALAAWYFLAGPGVGTVGAGEAAAMTTAFIEGSAPVITGV